MASNIKGENHIKYLESRGEIHLTKYDINSVLKSYLKLNLLDEAKADYKNGDLDSAYTRIYKFLSLTAYLTRRKGLLNFKEHSSQIFENYKCAIDLAERWKKEILMKFDDTNNSNCKPNIEATMANSPPNEDISYNCAWLHSKLVEDSSKVLIIDTRSCVDYSKSHMTFPDIKIVNVPEDYINEGESAATVYRKGIGPELDLYNKRNEFTYVVLLHKDPNSRVIKILYNILSKYDKHEYPNLVSLTEGYSAWCDFYPHCVNGIVPPCDNFKIFDEYDLSNVTYDDDEMKLSFNNEYNDTQQYYKSPTIPNFDRAKKPIENKSNKAYKCYTKMDEEKKNREAEKKLEIWSITKEKELEAERALILEKEAKEKQLLHERSIREQNVREDLERRRKLKNTVGESISITNRVDYSPSGNFEIHSDGEAKSKPSANSISQSEVPKFDRGSKPRRAILNPVIGESPGLTGLKNLGNTCYMNSILQCISNNSSLVRYFYESCFYNDINRKQQYQGEIAEKVAEVVRALWAGKHRAVACHPLKSAIGSIKPEYKTCEQQDSHEFLTYLMDWLHCDLKKDVPLVIRNDEKSEIEKVWKDFKIKNESVIFTLFYGLQRSTVECLTCDEQSSTYEPFSNLSLIIPDGNNVSLSDCLKLYLKEEIISGWRCPKCNVERKAKKTIDLCKLPNILVIHLKRFSFLDVSSRKRTTFVDFPLENLNLLNNDGQLRSYELFGVSNHYGSIESGHYTAYCKNPQYNRWYKFDDHEVLDLSPTNVTTSAAYILFYSSPDKKQLHS